MIEVTPYKSKPRRKRFFLSIFMVVECIAVPMNAASAGAVPERAFASPIRSTEGTDRDLARVFTPLEGTAQLSKCTVELSRAADVDSVHVARWKNDGSGAPAIASATKAASCRLVSAAAATIKSNPDIF